MIESRGPDNLPLPTGGENIEIMDSKTFCAKTDQLFSGTSDRLEGDPNVEDDWHEYEKVAQQSFPQRMAFVENLVEGEMRDEPNRNSI